MLSLILSGSVGTTSWSSPSIRPAGEASTLLLRADTAGRSPHQRSETVGGFCEGHVGHSCCILCDRHHRRPHAADFPPISARVSCSAHRSSGVSEWGQDIRGAAEMGKALCNLRSVTWLVTVCWRRLEWHEGADLTEESDNMESTDLGACISAVGGGCVSKCASCFFLRRRDDSNHHSRWRHRGKTMWSHHGTLGEIVGSQFPPPQDVHAGEHER